MFLTVYNQSKLFGLATKQKSSPKAGSWIPNTDFQQEDYHKPGLERAAALHIDRPLISTASVSPASARRSAGPGVLICGFSSQSLPGGGE